MLTSGNPSRRRRAGRDHPAHTLVLDYNEPQATGRCLQASHGDVIACVIVEPSPANMKPGACDGEFLRECVSSREARCDPRFDEVMSGFPGRPGGAPVAVRHRIPT